MYLIRLIYCSELNNVDTEGLTAILEASRRNNAKHGITGTLLFNGQFFLQCLEGGRKIVNTVYHRIVHDERHKNPTLLDYAEISQRDFSDWSMAYVPWTKDVRAVVRTYATTEDFDPYRMSGASALGLLRALRQRIE